MRAKEKAAGMLDTSGAAHEITLGPDSIAETTHALAQFQTERAKAIEACQAILSALRDDTSDLATVDELGHVLREEIWSSRVLQIAVRKVAPKKGR